VVRRAYCGAPPAHGARVEVGELFPGEVGDGAGAAGFQVGLGQVRHRPHGPFGAWPVREVQVGGGGHHVADLGGGQEDQERAEQTDMGYHNTGWRVFRADGVMVWKNQASP
jgi:hypothetical protein